MAMTTQFIMPRVFDQPQPRFYSPQYHQYDYQPPRDQSPDQPYTKPHPHPHHQPHSHYRSHSESHSPQSIYQQQQQQQLQLQLQHQQISPLSTSDDVSPTTTSSSMSHDNLPRRQPIYMPAVLRPNLYAAKPATANKPEDADRSSLQSNQSALTLSAWNLFGRITRRSTVDSGKCLDDDDDDDAVQWNLDLFPKPTAQPTREHWKADPEATICDEPACMRRFNYFTRRHHCRKCGNIFCDMHSAYDVPLDQDANYNPKGMSSRACAHCFSSFKAWRSRTNSQASSDNSSVVNGPHTAPVSPVASTPTAVKGAHKGPSDVAMSVPRDWNWSTF